MADEEEERGFKLGDAASECSMRSKARIDALFEDARSVRSSNRVIGGGWCVAPSLERCSLGIIDDDDDTGSEEQTRANGAVQARIEAMFASVEAETGSLGKSAAAVLPVRYMGAAPVGGRIASVRGLQEPLRQLLERFEDEDSPTAELEISRRGLTFRTADATNERTNPFRRIAVWSALRLSSRLGEGGSSPALHAFLPLVREDRTDRSAVGDSEERHADLYRVMRGLRREAADYPPVFAVVMRRPGAARLLECHGFACSSEDDAVAAAASLHRALLADLDSNRRRPRESNGLGRASLASVVSTSFGEASTILGRNCRLGPSAAANQPVRPPRIKKTGSPARRTKVSEIKAEDVLEARSRQLPATRNLLLPPAKDKPRVSPPAELLRAKETAPAPATCNHYEKLPNKAAVYSFVESRAGLTVWEERSSNRGRSPKVEAPQPALVVVGADDVPQVRKRTRAGSEPPPPRVTAERDAHRRGRRDAELKRSRSDLEVDRGDPMTRVELPRRGSFLKAANARLPNNATGGGTPLGFTELFDEFRNQEGLTSVDDILAAIIDPEGMSFNDLKPLYKEFLLKLAATLTQDELYERSASIMRRRGRPPQRRRSSGKPCLLGRAIRRSVSRFKGRPTEFTSVMIPARKLDDSFDGSSSCEARNERRRVLAARSSRRRSSWNKTRNALAHTTSEDSDTCRRVGRSGANRSSSGYVSCSECSYDSESCTCVSADKCYCSLSRRAPGASGEPLVCACDTDSCSDGNKCYCAWASPQPTIMEQLRQRGIVPSESTLSRAGSTDGAKTSRTDRSHASSKSLEFLKVRRSPGRGSTDNLGLDYDLFSPGKKSRCGSTGSERVLLVSARDPRGRLVYVGTAEREDVSGFENASNREALSIKKSAEIAAIFGSGSVRARPGTGGGSVSSARSSVSLEAGLGYLP